MAEAPSLPIIEEEEIGDEFYEKIEAPKFVDFSAPEILRSHDDRYWFCLRVGCDQNHEDELDSEAIYKNFVLRVMAARSPNVRLRKALNKREASANLKCPLTAPAKSSKSRVSRLALISSMSKKLVDNNVRTKPLSKVSATPIAKVKQSSAMAKALTTPRNQKKVSNIEQFRTVQSKKGIDVVVPKNRVVAKALVFHSPKKAVKIKRSIELNAPMKSLCSAMKSLTSAMNKLELDSVKKYGEGYEKSLPVAAASRKKFRGREVKSRVFDSLYSNSRKNQEPNSMRRLKEDKKVKKDLQKCQGPHLHEGADNDSSDMEIDEKSRVGSLEGCPESDTSGGGKELSMAAAKIEILSETSRGESSCQSSSEEAENKTCEDCENEKKRNPVSENGKIPEAIKRNDKKNSLASDDKENVGEHTENDEKENALAPDENRALIVNNDNLKKPKHEDSRKTHKKSTSNATGSQVVKYRKLKPTNPKPFKLRTDERGILKEANLEKKPLSPLKETTAKGVKAMRKHVNVNHKNEQDIDNNSCETRLDQATQEDQTGRIRHTVLENSNGKVKHNLSATPHRSAGPKLQKPIGVAEQQEHRDKAAQKLDDKFKRKSQMMQPKFVKPRGALSRKKESGLLGTPGKLCVINEKSSNILQPKEAAKPCKNGACKAFGYTSSSCSKGRRSTTVPKEPNFHSLHVPKSCTKKLT